ncbi:unnamed protein product, partial [marine sediment metagenome]
AVILMGPVIGTIGNLIKFDPKGLAIPFQKAEIATDPVCGMRVDTKKD